jgi:predicted esterase
VIDRAWWRCWLALGVAGIAWAQNASSVQSAANAFEAQRRSLPLTGDQRHQALQLQDEARQATAAGRFGEALRAYAHATAVLRKAAWTPAMEFAFSLEARADHVLLEPEGHVVLSLAALYPVQPEGTSLLASVFLASAGGQPERQLLPATFIGPARLPLAIRIEVPGAAPGNYELEIRLAPPGPPVPQIVHDVFLKSLPVHIEKLAHQAALLQERLAKAASDAAPDNGALTTAEYVLRFYERADRGKVGLRGFGRYPFTEQFAEANRILDDLEAGRDPFASKHGDFRRAYRSAVDQTLQPYRLFVPHAYDGSRDFPLVVALHGSGGDENDFFDSYPDAPLEPEAERLGFLVVCPKGRGPNSGYRGAAEQDVFDVLAQVRREYRVDQRRIYLMGHSMGAYAAWRLAAERPELFAALGLIAGGGDPAGMVKLRQVPQYVVHGALDEAVPVAQSRAMVTAARQAGATVVYVELPRAGHYDAALGRFGPMLDFFAKQERE